MPWNIVEDDGRCSASKPWAVVKATDGALQGCHTTKADAADQIAALNAAEESGAMSEENAQCVDPEVTAVELDGERVSLRDLAWATDQARVAHQANIHHPLENMEVRKSGKPGTAFNFRGRASVTDQWYDLFPGVREQIAPGAFDEVLATEPDVHALWDHDTSRVLGRTRNRTLQLVTNTHGLDFSGTAADTSYARDLQHLLERGDIDQSSFAFTVPEDGDQWMVREENGQSVVHRTITRIDQLFDVTITAKGANPFTDSSVARTAVRAVLHDRSRTFAVRGLGATREPSQPDQRDDSGAAASPQPSALADESAGTDPAITEQAEHLRARIAERQSAVKGLWRRTEKIHE